MRIALVLLVVTAMAAGLSSQQPAPAAPLPVEPIAAIVNAFAAHDVVAVTSPHGNNQVRAFLLSLVSDPRVSAVVHDIVIETASARYQDAIDRFVRGEDVEEAVLRKAWEEHTVPNGGLSDETEALLRAVRAANGSGGERRLRVLAGDPPIDWSNVVSLEDHRRWIELRDSYPADVIRRQVLERSRRALVIYGQGHLQRRQIASNYDMSTWQAQTAVSLLERDARARVFNIWTLLSDAAMPDRVMTWPVPTLALTRGTAVGAQDFDTYGASLGIAGRFGVQDGRLVPVPREEWRTLRMEDQFDAVLYLGPPTSMTQATIQRRLCQDARFMAERLERLQRFAPPSEVVAFRRACGL